MNEPRSGIIGLETDRDVVTSGANVDSVAAYRVDVVVGIAASAANNVERVLKNMSKNHTMRRL